MSPTSIESGSLTGRRALKGMILCLALALTPFVSKANASAYDPGLRDAFRAGYLYGLHHEGRNDGYSSGGQGSWSRHEFEHASYEHGWQQGWNSWNSWMNWSPHHSYEPMHHYGLSVGNWMFGGDHGHHFDMGGYDCSHEPPLTATPLPGALPLFSAGLGLVGLLGWRRRRSGPVPA